MKPATKPSLHIFAATLAAAVALCGAVPASAAGSGQASRAAARRTVEGFDITKEPTPADWRFFIKAKEASRE
jgi:hypothetical protein